MISKTILTLYNNNNNNNSNNSNNATNNANNLATSTNATITDGTTITLNDSSESNRYLTKKTTPLSTAIRGALKTGISQKTTFSLSLSIFSAVSFNLFF
jgi:hypothetical protein